jgi:hypothetical protein
VKQEIRSPAASLVSPPRGGSQAAVTAKSPFIDDFGTRATDTRPVTAADFFPPDSDFGRVVASEHDSFGKFAAPQQQQQQRPQRGTSGRGFLDESSEGGAVADEFAPTPAEDDFFRPSGSQSNMPEPQDDFFSGGGGKASESRDSPYNKSFDTLPAGSNGAVTEDIPAPEHDFALPASSTPPSSTNPFPVAEDFVKSPNIPHRHVDDHHDHPTSGVRVSSTNPFPVEADDFAAPAPASSNPFGGASAAPTGAPVASMDDLFAPLPSSDTAASGGSAGKLDDDDFFAPLSQAGKQEAEELEKATTGKSTFNAFDTPLFD